MASAESLPTSVEALTLQSTASTSKFPGCFPTLNPVDIYREHISEELGKVADVDPAIIYTRLQWTNTLDKGDLTLAVCDMTLHLHGSMWIGIYFSLYIPEMLTYDSLCLGSLSPD